MNESFAGSKCNDGWESPSSGRGTCSHHGGVASSSYVPGYLYTPTLKDSDTLKDVVILDDGTMKWYKNGQLHRTDGPAVEYADGSTMWFLNGKRHRVGGPAIEKVDGSTMWYLNGVCYLVVGSIGVDKNLLSFMQEKCYNDGGPAAPNISEKTKTADDTSKESTQTTLTTDTSNEQTSAEDAADKQRRLEDLGILKRSEPFDLDDLNW